MATVKKLKFTRYVLPDPTDAKKVRYVNAGTSGAKKISEEGNTYFIVWKESGKQKKEATGLTDKRAAQAFLAQWITAREHGRTGLVDPFKTHLDRLVIEHLDDYLQGMTDGTHKKEVSRVIRNVIEKTGSVKLRDVTADKITDYLTAHPASVGTRIKHRVYLSGFFAYLFRLNRVPANVTDRVAMPTTRSDEKPRRVRRPYTLAELQRLMRAACEYPVAVRGVNKGGRPRKDGKPAQLRNPPQLTEEYRDQLTRDGKERELVYRLLLSTGLRRGELSRVTVAMFNNDKIIAPNRILKHKPPRATHLVFPVVPTLAAELQAHVIGKTPKDKLVKVPCASNMIREHQARLKHAGVEYKTEDGAADVHAFRMTMNIYLKRKGVEHWKRQLCLRHTAKDITSRNYDPDNTKPRTMKKSVYRLMSRLDELIISTREVAQK